MLLDQGAREWLGHIEVRKKQLDKVIPVLKDAMKRRSKLKSAKALAAADAEIEELFAEKNSAEAYVEAETQLFFKNVFGILESTPVAMQNKHGETSRTLYATDLTARLLADGTGVFTVSGDALEGDVAKGLPRPDYLLVQESAGQKFVVLG